MIGEGVHESAQDAGVHTPGEPDWTEVLNKGAQRCAGRRGVGGGFFIQVVWRGVLFGFVALLSGSRFICAFHSGK